jgi:hypothetical protein
MYRFRLKSATMAMCHHDGFKGEAVVIPTGSEIISVDPVEIRKGFDRARLIEVGWGGKTVRMFLLDLLERGERIEGAG